MVTFAVSPVEVSPYEGHLAGVHDAVTSLKDFAKEECTNIIKAAPATDNSLAASTSGFVRGVIQAYNEHQNLELRPDDIWLAIMVQFGLYVNGHAEDLRASLVKHDGKETLVVEGPGTLYTANYGKLSVEMIAEMERFLVDPTLGQWILPSFTTTTDHDRIVGSVVMMAAMKEYFAYVFCLRCGIPNVTLLGSVTDWEDIRSRVDKLKGFGLTAWADMLAPVLDQFVVAAKGAPDVGFWQRICHKLGGGSSRSYISGWISVFCVFKDDGTWQGTTEATVRGEAVTSEFPIVDTGDIPSGYLTVPVTVDDNGVEYATVMFAGHMAFEAKQGSTTIAPHLSWAIALKKGDAASAT
ncbi:Aste57867_19963 [Aphanomyces stellatus]|uniref:Aste57867_19963 protein n=1 Tax=Aphanomyces stellatus TaxID=120398 RepID=A0A485LDX2_9STRA|nr:hypothetical protein As57867_019897 [Aphanomyces stellatus]VFT96660.1 Aste57867_19963 [Aphanomyces stellatus]